MNGPSLLDTAYAAPLRAHGDTTSTIALGLGEEVRGEIAAHFARRAAVARTYGPEFTRLWQLTGEHAQGGKLLRPFLLVRAHAAMSRATGRTWVTQEQLLRLASAIELLHFAFLLHDDVIDGDVLRRGDRNLVGALSAELESSRVHPERVATGPHEGLHWGQSAAILAGNLLLSQVHQAFARVPLPPGVRERVLDLLDHAITETVAGEHADVALSEGVAEADLDTILATAIHKTATYTFALPLLLAATLADAPAGWAAHLEAASRHLGLAFQLQDDYLSVFGDPALHGKDPHSDLREGKETAIVAFARRTSSWQQLDHSFGDRTLSEADAARAVAALRDCGADRFVVGLVAEHREALARLLDDRDELAGDARTYSLPRAVRDLLLEFDAHLVGRET